MKAEITLINSSSPIKGLATGKLLTLAYVAISMNGVLLDAQLAGPTGIVDLTFPAISNIGVADIVVTAVGIAAGLEDIVAAAELGGRRAAALEPASCDAAPE